MTAIIFRYRKFFHKTLLSFSLLGALFFLSPLRVMATPLSSSADNEFMLEGADIPVGQESSPLAARLKFMLEDKQYGSVLSNINKLSEPEKNKEEVISLKAAALAGLGDFDSAMKEYSRLKNIENSLGKSYSVIADVLLKKKKPFAALVVCQTGLMQDVNSANLLYQAGYSYGLLGKTETSLVYLKAADSANILSHKLESQYDIKRAIAAAYYKLNDFESAKKAIERSALDDLDNGFRLIINAKYQASIGNFGKAITILDEAQSTSRATEAILIQAQLQILNSKPDLAIKLLDSLDPSPKRNNFSDILKLIKSLAYLTSNEATLSLRLLEELERPENVQNIHMLKAITYFALNKKSKVIEELKKASLPYSELATLPGFEKYLNEPSLGADIGLAFFCLDQKFYNQAVIIAEKAARKFNGNIFLNFIVAESYLQAEKFPKAINELVKINERFKGSYALQFYLSQAYAKAGMVKEATQTYRILTDERPDFVLANLVYGKLLSDHSEWNKAREVYENGLNFMPDSPNLQISLGWSLASLDELDALDTLLQIMKKNKKVGRESLLHLEGWAAFKRNDFSLAENLLSKALASAPGDPEICYHLGRAMLKNGKTKVAKNLLQQSLLFKRQRKRYKQVIEGLLAQN